MGVLDAFMSTWSSARETFGQGVPQTGERFDESGSLMRLQTTVESAAPGSRWTGTAAAAYDAANKDHGKVFAQLADLDQRLGKHVTASSQVVASGRQDLDAVRKWVLDAAASVPPGKNREQLLMPIVQRGLGQVSQIVTKSNGELSAIGGQIRTIGNEYQALGNQKFGPKEGVGDAVLGSEGEDGDTKRSPHEQGAADSAALQDGTLTPEQRERLTSNTQLTPAQQVALDQGNLTLPPERMSYLQGFSREFGDKTPTEIKAIMDRSGADGGKVADAFQLASNPNVHTGLPETNPPSIDHPSSGGTYALPEGIQRVLDGPAMTQPMSSGVFQDGRWIVPPEPTGPLQPTQGLNDLANIVQQGDRSLQHGTALDSGLMAKSQEMLEVSNQHSQLGPADDAPRWYHDNVDPTLQNMFNAVNADDMVIHDAVTGPGGEHFLNDLTNHQWQDDGLAAGGLFDWVGADAADDPTGRAAQTAHALAEYTSSHHSDLLNLESTRGIGAEGQSLGQVNPELTRDWARAFSPYFDDMVGNNTGGNDGLFAPLDPADGTKTEPTNTRNLMSVLMSDHPPMDQQPGSGAPKTASEILFDSTQQHVHTAFENAALSAVPGGPVTDDYAMQSAGRLQAALNLGSYDEAASRLHNTFQAQHESWQLQGKLYDLGAGFVDQYGAPGAAASDIAAFGKDFVIGPEPIEGKPPNVTIPGTFPTERFMAEVLAHNGAGDMSALDGIYDNGVLNEPPGQSGTADYRDYHNAIKAYLDSIGEPGATNDLMQTYWNTYTSSVFGAT
ncbi:EspA/EspE family type VII secretion system effector [Mycolicibacterium hodleri]|uniref:Uncharacterized protein n=1 Tax=Mycolicibacterium hodleri TaxID=49897 RepID=A0A502EEX1_9MYCO|nr:EspA/EspE family type VII secretion system effector [Mycolicibacterium hodleri]TPG36007.1 hypothetical protein EAH80_08320 [Mycolicibacterium hodleri]